MAVLVGAEGVVAVEEGMVAVEDAAIMAAAVAIMGAVAVAVAAMVVVVMAEGTVPLVAQAVAVGRVVDMRIVGEDRPQGAQRTMIVEQHHLGAETTLAEAATTEGGARILEDEAQIMVEGVVETTMIEVETEVGTTEDMVAESAWGVPRVVTVEMPEVIDMGLQALLSRASLLQAAETMAEALELEIAATHLVRDLPHLQVAPVWRG